jgi:hypothetical protein
MTKSPVLLPHRHRSIPRLWHALGLVLFWGSLLAVLFTSGVSEVTAHAALERAEPPIDGLVIAAPGELRLFFTEDVASADPAPTVHVLNEAGELQSVSSVSMGSDGDPASCPP